MVITKGYIAGIADIHYRLRLLWGAGVKRENLLTLKTSKSGHHEIIRIYRFLPVIFLFLKT